MLLLCFQASTCYGRLQREGSHARQIFLAILYGTVISILTWCD
jgi:hypothetical protein